MAGPFKMKGSPMARNFGIGTSPAKDKIPTDIEQTTRTNYKSSKSKSTQNEKSMSEDEAENIYVSTELKKRQNKRQAYMHKSVAVWDAQDEIDIADIKSKRGKIKGKDYY